MRVCVCVCVRGVWVGGVCVRGGWMGGVCVRVCVCVCVCIHARVLPSSGRTLQHKTSLQGFTLPAGVKPSLSLVLHRLVLYSCNHLKIIFNKHEKKTYCFQATGPVPLRAGHLKQPHLF